MAKDAADAAPELKITSANPACMDHADMGCQLAWWYQVGLVGSIMAPIHCLGAEQPPAITKCAQNTTQ